MCCLLQYLNGLCVHITMYYYLIERKKKKWVESFQQILLLFYRNDDEGDDGDRGASERAKQLFLISWMV